MSMWNWKWFGNAGKAPSDKAAHKKVMSVIIQRVRIVQILIQAHHGICRLLAHGQPQGKMIHSCALCTVVELNYSTVIRVWVADISTGFQHQIDFHVSQNEIRPG